MCPDWEPYWEILKQDLPYRERLAAYAAIGHQRMETDRFREYCDQHLTHLEEQTHEFSELILRKIRFDKKLVRFFQNTK